MTLLDGLDLSFSPIKRSPNTGDMVGIRTTEAYIGDLKAALEAALALCRAYHTYIHCVPDHDAEEALSYVAHFETDLDTALKPFKKEGLG